MNTSGENRALDGLTKNKVLKVILIVVFVLAVFANGVQGYFLWKYVKAYRNLEAIINSKSNCDKCPAQIEATPEPEPTPTPTTTTTKSRSTDSDTSSQPDTSEDTVATPEPVIPPPPPPAD